MSETRKIVRIDTGRTALGSHVLYALCNDGTVWWWRDLPEHREAWTPLPPIPQPEAVP